MEKMRSIHWDSDNEQAIRRSRYAIADAVMVAYSYSPDDDIHKISTVNGGGDEQEREQWLERITASKCDTNAKNALFYLAKKYPHQFTKLCLVKTDEQTDEYPFRDPDWVYHTHMVAQDTAGKWYAASPANYSLSDAKNLLCSILEANTPEELMQKIQSQDGGVWPQGSLFLDMPAYRHPTCRPKRYSHSPDAYEHQECTLVVHYYQYNTDSVGTATRDILISNTS